ncbi:DUF4446 family protein [Caldinitratiruptor microaerophilus]|uniref:DUF4446 family protein n=1 Tax=Caldinitratiruptor microaerophilus TaxID=671077 RepID=A0AA35CMD7_9FIRM|nr:DUF4446 family protein [Caldinitratiruptor microaerophilus]BDG61862.1 hypothetical protein caldi_29520 [Caldinitratiruptor microaerophilus]
MTELASLLERHAPLLLGALLALVAVLLAAVLLLALRQRALLHRYRQLLGGPRGQELEDLLLEQARTLQRLEDRVRDLEQALERTVREGLAHVRHVGLVRYQAFPDVGGNLSFSLALLDGTATGAVVTSLWTRSECRLYAKPVVRGTSPQPLSAEEQEALAQALAEAGSPSPAQPLTPRRASR